MTRVGSVSVLFLLAAVASPALAGAGAPKKPSAGARPQSSGADTNTPGATKPGGDKPKEVVKLSKRKRRLKYLSVPLPALEHAQAYTIQLPDGARIRELACYAQYFEGDSGGIFLYRQSHADGKRTPIADARGKASVGHDWREVAVALDHTVDNFSNAYYLRADGYAFALKLAFVRSCRIGYRKTRR
jgi:hypothetical protein